MLTDDDVQTLTRAGLEFDSLVEADWLEASGEKDTAAAVDTLGILRVEAAENLELKPQLALLEQTAKESALSEPKVRLAAARIIARWKLDAASENGPEGVVSALEEFRSRNNGDLISAVDILASAILLPKGNFGDACFAANHASGALANQYGVPLGVVALRQHVLLSEASQEAETPS